MATLEHRVVTAAQAALNETKTVSPLEVLCRIGWVHQNHVDQWRQGRVDHLQPLVSIRPGKLELVLDTLRRWAEERGLSSTEAVYVSATRDRRTLRFVSGDDEAERPLRTHWISGELSEAQRDRVVERQNRAPDLP